MVQTNKRSRPLFAGVTTLNTRDTIERARALVDIGVDGLFVGRPMWLAMDDKSIVRYYQDIAAALPGVPMVAYDNPVAFKGKISTEPTWNWQRYQRWLLPSTPVGLHWPKTCVLWVRRCGYCPWLLRGWLQPKNCQNLPSLLGLAAWHAHLL